MYWDVVTVQLQDHLRLKVKFADGLEGTVRFKFSHLTGVFDSLKDQAFFNLVFLDNGVVTWPGELDLAPDAMYAEIKKKGEWILE
ncbi:MAG: DUF2442 domain-containing protein [Gammaproteobacteria bacterium]|nr:DUF2442 domain-containing protein [Gammaproteobacteria bacterium]